MHSKPQVVKKILPCSKKTQKIHLKTPLLISITTPLLINKERIPGICEMKLHLINKSSLPFTNKTIPKTTNIKSHQATEWGTLF